MRRSIEACAVATVLTAFAGITGCSGGSDDPGSRSSDPPSPEQSVTETGDRPTRGAESGTLLIHGTVRDDGEPVAGARVRVWVMSTEDLEAGETVPTWEPEPARTDELGHYAIDADPDRIPSSFFPAHEDFVNVDLGLSTDEVSARWATTAWLLRDPDVWRTQGSRPGDQVLRADVDLGDATITLTDSQGHSSTGELTLAPGVLEETPSR